MPKGHYERKPRNTTHTSMDEGTRPLNPPSEEELVAAAMDNPFWRASEAEKLSEPAPIGETHSVDVMFNGVIGDSSAGEPDDAPSVVAEPVVLAVPPHDMVAFKVGMWAGSLCRGWHEVDWRSADDGASLEVTLETAHGTSTLKAPAGNWTEADVDAALAQMRSDLRV